MAYNSVLSCFKKPQEGGPGSGRYPAGSGKNPQADGDKAELPKMSDIKNMSSSDAFDKAQDHDEKFKTAKASGAKQDVIDFHSNMSNFYHQTRLAKQYTKDTKQVSYHIRSNKGEIRAKIADANSKAKDFYSKAKQNLDKINSSKESATPTHSHLKEHAGRILEAKQDADGNLKFPVVIISQGLGNLSDKNYYTADAIKSAPEVYEGKKVYFDHPTQTQSKEQPGRSVLEACGHYENCRAIENKDGVWELHADLVPEKDSPVISKIKHAIEYKKKYPDQDYIGISINGDGEGKSLPYEELLKEYEPKPVEMEKLSKVEGHVINAITKLTSAVSADLVTEPGAKGRFLKESEKALKKRRTKMFEAMKKFLLGAESGDKEMLESAVADLMEGEVTEAKKAEDEAMGKEAECMAKHLLACKKEMKKYEDESEGEYEARCMKQAMVNVKKELETEMKKETEDESEKKESAAGTAEKKETKAEDETEKKEAADDKDADADDEGHADKAQDIALIKKMMKQMDDMKKEIESMKQSKMEAETEAKKHHESATKAEIALAAKERAEVIDRELAESGLPRYATKKLNDLFLSKNVSKDERKKMIEAAKEVHSKAIEAAFYGATSTGFTEISTSEKPASTDHLFN